MGRRHDGAGRNLGGGRMELDKIKIEGVVKITMADVITGEVEITKYKNIIPLVARAVIARRLLSSSGGNDGLITYGAIGTGTTAAASGDTKLQIEIARKVLASSSVTSNVLTVRVFFTTSEANGDLREYGLFGEDATAAADSGTLFERVNINRTKTNTKTLLIESRITIS